MTVEFAIGPAREPAPLPEPFHAWRLPDGTPWTEFHRDVGGYRLRFPDLADFVVSADGRRVRCEPAPDATDAVVEQLYLNQVLPLALSKQGRLVFHASAVEVDGGALAFVGVSGRGKSTLAAGFAIDGRGFLTDDGLVVERATHGHVALPSHPSIRLWQDSEEALLAPDTPVAPALSYTSKARFLAGGQLAFCAAPRPLRRVYFLGDGGADDVAIRPLSGSEAMIEWVRHSFLLDVEEQPRLASHFDQVAALANEPIHFALDYPRRYDALARVRAAIVAHAQLGSPQLGSETHRPS